MSKEIGWVALPRPFPRTLPPETLLRCGPGSCTYRAIKEVRLNVDRYWSDWGTAAYSKIFENEWLGDLDKATVRLPPGYRFEGSEVVKEETVAIPASLAGAVGLEKYANEAYAQAIQGQWQSGIQIQYGDCPRPECARKSWNPMRDRCDHCGVTGKEIAAKRARPACKCGATENVRHVAWSQHRCGSCEQSRRRAELQAQKLEQTKRDMSRPVKRDPYEWLGFSSADWEE
jgi:hypothetical protein